MNKRSIVLFVALISLVFSSVLAFHYRSEAARFETEWLQAAAAMAEQTGPTIATASLAAVSAPSDADPDWAEEVDRLKAELVRRDEMIANMRNQVRQIPMSTEQIAAVAPPARGDWLENLREEDPERYEQIQQRRIEMRQRVQDSFARKAAHFLYRDTNFMSEAEQVEHGQMLSLLENTWRLAERVQDDSLSWEDRRPIRAELMEQVAELRPLLESARDRELYDLGRQLGYDEAGAAQFVEYINDMHEVSSFTGIFRGRGMGYRMWEAAP
jgi:hypothetical protein